MTLYLIYITKRVLIPTKDFSMWEPHEDVRITTGPYEAPSKKLDAWSMREPHEAVGAVPQTWRVSKQNVKSMLLIAYISWNYITYEAFLWSITKSFWIWECLPNC